jgi:hypothetical protein
VWAGANPASELCELNNRFAKQGRGQRTQGGTVVTTAWSVGLLTGRERLAIQAQHRRKVEQRSAPMEAENSDGGNRPKSDTALQQQQIAG